MSAAAATESFAISTLAEASRHDRFRAAESAVMASEPIDIDGMIGVVSDVRDGIEASVRAAEAAFGAPFDAGRVRTCARLQRTAEFLGALAQRRDDVKALLRTKPQRRRA